MRTHTSACVKVKETVSLHVQIKNSHMFNIRLSKKKEILRNLISLIYYYYYMSENPIILAFKNIFLRVFDIVLRIDKNKTSR